MTILQTTNEFWRAEEKRLSGLATTLKTDTVDAMVALKFLLTARHNLKRLQELEDAYSWRKWPFYKAIAKGIAIEFNITL